MTVSCLASSHLAWLLVSLLLTVPGSGAGLPFLLPAGAVLGEYYIPVLSGGHSIRSQLLEVPAAISTTACTNVTAANTTRYH
jgi:hypothetical protein